MRIRPRLRPGRTCPASTRRSRPQDDLYRHINGNWLRQYQLPPDKSGFGSFNEAAERTQAQLRAIVTGIAKSPAPGSDEQKIRDLYDGVLDTATLDRLGLTPVADLLASVDAAADKAALAKVMGALSMAGVTGLVNLYVGSDKKDSTHYLPGLSQSGLGMPDQSYYRDPRRADVRTAYQAYLRRIATAAHFADPAAVASATYNLESRIAAAHWDNVHTRDTAATYNVLPWSQLATLAPGFEWDQWLAAGTDHPELFAIVNVDEPSFLTAVAQLWRDVDIATWRDYLRISIVRGFGRYLSVPSLRSRLRFLRERRLAGWAQPPERWKTAIGVVDENIGELLGKSMSRNIFRPTPKISHSAWSTT